MVKLAPSILSADFSSLKQEIDLILSAGAQMVHVDVMDGHFVPNISIGVPVVQSLRKATEGFLDVHLMISQPEQYVDAFLDAGADLINMHVEATGDLGRLLRHIRARGKKAALTIKPKTSPIALYPYLDLCDMVLVMSVEPGFGGQKFMESALPKIGALRQEIKGRGLKTEIQVDGGVTLENAPAIIAAGADILVAGSSVFAAPDVAGAVKAFLAL